MIFESNQAGSVMVTTAEIQFSRAIVQSFLYSPPDQEHHAAESIEARIGATVLVGNNVLKGQRDDAGDRNAIFRGCDSNLQFFA